MQKNNITVSQLSFIFCQLLYQSVHFYILPLSSSSNTQTITDVSNSLFEYQHIQATVIIGLAFVCCFGWVQVVFYRKVSYILEIGNVWTALAFAVMCIHLPNQITKNFILTQLLPIILITFSNLIKVLFLHQLMPDPSFNRLTSYSKFMPLFILARIIILPIFSLLINSEVTIYLLISFQFISLFHRIVYLSYYYPQAQWWNMVTQLWGWICLIKAIGKLGISGAGDVINYGLTNWLMVVICVMIITVCVWPGNRLIILQKKLENVLLRMKKTRNFDHHIVIMFFYSSIALENEYNYLQNYWSAKFKLSISLKLTEKDHKISEYLQQIHNQKTTSYHTLKSTLFKSSTTSTYQSPQILTSVIYNKQRLLQYINAKHLNNPTNIFQYSFELTYFICYFLLQTYPSQPKYIYQMYYRIKQKYQILTNNLFHKIEMTNLFDIINSMVVKHDFKGNYIRDILMLDQFYAILQRYLANEREYLGFFVNFPRFAENLHSYLSNKVKLKKQLKKLLRSLQFLYPNYQTLTLHKYVLQRYLQNNEILSKCNLMQQMSRNNMNTHKTKMLNFQINNTKNDVCVILCRWGDHDCGDIVKWNRACQKIMEFGRNKKGKYGNGIKLKDILPQFWRNEHENKFKSLLQLNQNYQHNYQSTYYICSATNRYLQSRNLRIYPYFELPSQMYFLIQTKINNKKQLTITPKSTFLSKSNNLSKPNLANYSLQLPMSHCNNNKSPSKNNIENKLRSKHQIPFLHQIQIYNNSNDNGNNDNSINININNSHVSNRQFDTVDISYKIIQIFNQQYIIQTKQKCLNMFTKHIILNKNQLNLNQDIQAVISMGIKTNNNKIQILQKGKQNVDIFNDIKFPILLKIIIINIVLLVCIILIISNFNSFSKLSTSSLMFQMGYHYISINLISFQQALQGFIRKYSQQYTSDLMTYLINYKTQSLSSFFMVYMNSTIGLAVNDNLFDAVFHQYQSIDTFAIINPTQITKNNILEHLNLFNTLTDSNAQLLRTGKYNHWLLNYYQYTLQNMLQLLKNNNYIQNAVLSNLKQIVKQQTNKLVSYYWILLIIAILCVIVMMAIIVKGKYKIEDTLTKPLLANYEELSYFRANIQSIGYYIEKQMISSQKNIVKEMDQTYYKTMTSIQTSSLKYIKQQFQSEQSKQKKQGYFFTHYLFVLLTPILLSLMLSILCAKLSINKSGFISNLEQKVGKIQQFAQFNRNIFHMYHLLLSYQADRQQVQDANNLQNIQKIRKSINQVNITQIINTMMIEQNTSNEILFSNPCNRSKICQLTNRTIHPYPIQLNLFLSNFNNLFLLLQDQVPKQDKRYNQLVFQTFVSALAISEIDTWIFQANQQAVKKINNQNNLLQVLCYVSLIGFVATIIVEVIRIFQQGIVYGKQIISMFPSGIMCRSQAFQYQVNCILYRTNFARHLISK